MYRNQSLSLLRKLIFWYLVGTFASNYPPTRNWGSYHPSGFFWLIFYSRVSSPGALVSPEARNWSARLYGRRTGSYPRACRMYDNTGRSVDGPQGKLPPLPEGGRGEFLHFSFLFFSRVWLATIIFSGCYA